jgi:L-ascorbate metabolism protein UlaG (beta-lactamase superfamily)
MGGGFLTRAVLVRELVELASWKLTGDNKDWPNTYPSPFAPDRPPSRVERQALHVSFVGHATFLIQGAGLNILTDPVWSKRAHLPGIAFNDLPRIDVVLVSHGHYDHLDVETLARLWHRDRSRIIAPLGNDATIRRHDAAIEDTTADWKGAVPLGNGVETVLEQVHRRTARGLWDRKRALLVRLCAARPRTDRHSA